MPATGKISLLQQCRKMARIGAEHLMDQVWGVDTLSGTWTLPQESGLFSDSSPNVPVSYYLLYRYFRGITLKPDDVFYDIGCGNGRVVCFIARKQVAKVVGVELSHNFATM